jgi:DNA-directed RNA polymerase subunit RPC12/RpoP
MEQRVYHGPVTPQDFAKALLAEFGGGDYRVRRLGDEENLVIQIHRPDFPASGGQTSITVHLLRSEDGVLARLGQQAWLGVAASLGQTALSAMRNPLSLVGRLDDLAQDIDSLQLRERIWETMNMTADTLGASLELSEALRRISCPYCRTANPIGAAHCRACGAPLGEEQPIACPNCGFVSPAGTAECPECGAELPSS